MKKTLLALSVVIGSLGIYGLADAAQTVFGTTGLHSGQTVKVTCWGSKLATTRVSARTVLDTCSGYSTRASADRSTTTTTTTTTTTMAPPATTDGNCTNPVYSTSDAEGTYNVDPGPSEYWWVNNDAWSGSAGPQTIQVCDQSSWNAVSDQSDNQGQIETYPDTEYDIGGRDDQPPSNDIAATNSITSTFSEAFPSAGDWDAAYDIWLNNWTTEIMIWNQWSGSNSYWPAQATQTLSLDGVPYSFYNNGGELMFFRQTQVSSGSVDILAALQWLVSQGLVKSSDVPWQLEYGVEISATTGTETFPMTDLSFSLS